MQEHPYTKTATTTSPPTRARNTISTAAIQPSFDPSSQATYVPPNPNANDTIATAPGTHNEPPTLHHLEPHPKHTNNRQTPPQPHITRPNTQQIDFVQQGATPQT